MQDTRCRMVGFWILVKIPDLGELLETCCSEAEIPLLAGQPATRNQYLIPSTQYPIPNTQYPQLTFKEYLH